jgi:hypothetical protein
MLQSDRNWLFNMAYGLDILPRVRVPKGSKLPFKEVDPDHLDKLRIQEKTEGLYVLFTEDQLSKLAEELRDLAARDEARVIK